MRRALPHGLWPTILFACRPPRIRRRQRCRRPSTTSLPHSRHSWTSARRSTTRPYGHDKRHYRRQQLKQKALRFSDATQCLLIADAAHFLRTTPALVEQLLADCPPREALVAATVKHFNENLLIEARQGLSDNLQLKRWIRLQLRLLKRAYHQDAAHSLAADSERWMARLYGPGYQGDYNDYPEVRQPDFWQKYLRDVEAQGQDCALNEVFANNVHQLAVKAFANHH